MENSSGSFFLKPILFLVGIKFVAKIVWGGCFSGFSVKKCAVFRVGVS